MQDKRKDEPIDPLCGKNGIAIVGGSIKDSKFGGFVVLYIYSSIV